MQVPGGLSTSREVEIVSTSTPVQALVVVALMWDLPGARHRYPLSWASRRSRLLCRPQPQSRPRNLGGDLHDCSRSRSTGLLLNLRARPARIRNRSPLEHHSRALLLHLTTKLHASRWASSASMSKRFLGALPRIMSRISSNRGTRHQRRVRVRALLRRIERGEGRRQSHDRFQERLVPFSSGNGDCGESTLRDIGSSIAHVASQCIGLSFVHQRPITKKQNDVS